MEKNTKKHNLIVAQRVQGKVEVQKMQVESGSEMEAEVYGGKDSIHSKVNDLINQISELINGVNGSFYIVANMENKCLISMSEVNDEVDDAQMHREMRRGIYGTFYTVNPTNKVLFQAMCEGLLLSAGRNPEYEALRKESYKNLAEALMTNLKQENVDKTDEA